MFLIKISVITILLVAIMVGLIWWAYPLNSKISENSNDENKIIPDEKFNALVKILNTPSRFIRLDLDRYLYFRPIDRTDVQICYYVNYQYDDVHIMNIDIDRFNIYKHLTLKQKKYVEQILNPTMDKLYKECIESAMQKTLEKVNDSISKI